MSFEKETGRDVYFKQLKAELEELIDSKTGMLSEHYSKLIDCPICKHPTSEILFIKQGYTFVRCPSCALVYTNPQVDQQVVQRMYQKGLPSTDLWYKVLLTDKDYLWRSNYFVDIVEKIEQFVSVGKILDVGSALGHFLHLCQSRGWDVTGLELSEMGAQYARDHFKITIHQKLLNELDFVNEQFDAISLNGVLEHITDPINVLRDSHKLLREGGVISLVVPNVYALLNIVLHEKANTFDGRNHLIYFSFETLKRSLELAGFKVIFQDSMLTGIPNLLKYLQYHDPFDGPPTQEFIPLALKKMIGDKGQALEKFILKNDLGLRIRMIAKKI